MSHELFLADADATTRIGAALATQLAGRRGGVIYLEGDLGAGKTTLARGLLRGLGVTGTIRSPTYTLMEPYLGTQGPILHLDLYRLASPLELENLGLADHSPAHTLWLVEWPDQGAPLLPPADLRVQLEPQAGGRRARFCPVAGWAGDALAAALSEK